MTIREELKKLVAKLGGTPSIDDQTAELIHKVTDNVSGGGGGGSSLIPVTVDQYGQTPLESTTNFQLLRVLDL